MRAPQDYHPTPRPLSGKPRQRLSEKSDPRAGAVLRQIRASLIARGATLRQWARAWAEANGRDPAASYETLRSTIARRLERGLEPQGELGARLVADLRADLGVAAVPYPRIAPEAAAFASGASTPAGGSPASPERTPR